MDAKRLLLVAAVVIVLLVGGFVGAISLYSDYLYESSYESSYDYRVSFAANQTLSDLTVYVPLPVEDGEVRIVGANVSARSWDETTPENAPPVNATVVDTERGPMLAITARGYPVEPRYYRFVEEDGMGRREEVSGDEYEPGNPEMVAYTERSVEVTVSTRSQRAIDTVDPTGTEPLLAPETDRREVPCRNAHFETQRCFSFESQAYLSYDGPPNTRASVWVELSGRNEWWVFGWNGNEYRELVTGEFFGPQEGWRTVEGEFETGFGNYAEPPEANRTG